jgi:hypothetical protein
MVNPQMFISTEHQSIMASEFIGISNASSSAFALFTKIGLIQLNFAIQKIMDITTKSKQ